MPVMNLLHIPHLSENMRKILNKLPIYYVAYQIDVSAFQNKLFSDSFFLRVLFDETKDEHKNQAEI